MSNNNYGQGDLFSYFGDDFAEALEYEEKNKLQHTSDQSIEEDHKDNPPSESLTSDPAAEKSQGESRPTKLISLESRRRVSDSFSNDGCPDACSDKELDDDEKDALEDKASDEQEADKRELSGESGNTSVIKSDEKTPVTAKKEIEKPELNHATFICYSGLSISITKFFSEDKLAGLELEDVRKRLEKDYPELSKQRTKMDWDKKKNIIVPMVTGGKKGARFTNGTRGFYSSSQELIEHQEPISYLAAQDGYYEIRENLIGVFIGRTAAEELIEWEGFSVFNSVLPKHLDREPCRPGFKYKLPKIPKQLFAQLVSFFMDYTDYDVEVMGVFYYDIDRQQFILDVPYQSVTKYSVNPWYSVYPGHVVKVAEIHSHNTMRADFSSIDDEDEVGTMLYGVVGKIKKGHATDVFFDVRTRAGMAGKFIPIDPKVFIEGELTSNRLNNHIDYVAYPKDWVKKVTIIGGNRND
ncbi:hypothetical protein PUW24_00595 (plasmid) [Paenibacillus urinalis]|uniref:JAB domain-containing protein n=1 Tax=Paenibacillus urinalis TaxID=521520 RepID=A0AAX3N7X1_9BACL|nr:MULTISPECIES: hypothetical protein [Paenibacillus]MCM3130586.1 hypothetical protein [Paenibacillus sp. MER 78]WDH85313.1 hypothetical protein PUW23_26105 [Paenibacillus urinalis]WDH95088.1 hypothetical protein PUW24_00595 [Paenibacillus urinalis]WDI05267.1 hypothetical protein PUW25_26970 [Paenibacillus urinalis]